MNKFVFTGSVMAALLVCGCKAPKKLAASVPAVFDKEGHRGCRGLMPENTIPAMLKAIDLGVTTLEMDIAITRDSVPILSHDPYFNHELTTRPDGGYIEQKEERKFAIYRMPFAETQQYDVGLKANPRYPRRQNIKAVKPSLAVLIDSVEAYLQMHQLPKVDYNIETKTNPSTDNIFHPAPAEFVDILMSVIRSKGIENRVIIQSFDFRTLQLIHQQYPALRTAMLIEAYDKRTPGEQISALGFVPTIYSPAYSLVNPALVETCHQNKMKLIPWTVDDEPTIERLKKLGVDGIISDYPDLFGK